MRKRCRATRRSRGSLSAITEAAFGPAWARESALGLRNQIVARAKAQVAVDFDTKKLRKLVAPTSLRRSRRGLISVLWSISLVRASAEPPPTLLTTLTAPRALRREI